MDPDRDAGPGAGGAGLAQGQREQLERLLGLLEEDTQAPTAITDRQAAAERHLADSLSALELAAVAGARRVADLGSGSGFPGAALAVALPGAQVALVESRRRRCAFLERLAEAAGLGNVAVVCARAEEWPEGLLAHDLVVARALGPQPVVLEYAAPLLALGGWLVDWRGRRSAVEEEAAALAAQALGLRRAEIRRTIPFPGARDHHLHVFEKVQETPARFPRRAGMARKRPLAV